MTDHEAYPVNPMTAFYAAVAAVENGAIGEIELEYRFMAENDDETVLTMVIRRDVRHFVGSYDDQGE